MYRLPGTVITRFLEIKLCWIGEKIMLARVVTEGRGMAVGVCTLYFVHEGEVKSFVIFTYAHRKYGYPSCST